MAAVRTSGLPPSESSPLRRTCCRQAICADGSDRMNVLLLKERGRGKARVPIVGGDDMAALGKAATGQGVDAIDELHERE